MTMDSLAESEDGATAIADRDVIGAVATKVSSP